MSEMLALIGNIMIDVIIRKSSILTPYAYGVKIDGKWTKIHRQKF
jgi:hypothetical protein